LSDQFRSIHGIVQFPPKEGEANGKPVRNITVRQVGFGPTAVKVSATLWPSHAHVDVAEGDVVTFDGKYTPNKGKNRDGEPVTYHNVSITRISVNGSPADPGVKVESDDNDVEADDTPDEDIPF